MIKLSSELRTKIKQDMELSKQDFLTDSLQGTIFFEDHELKLFKECVDWYDHIIIYFKTSYIKRQVKIDAGKYKGIFPIEVLHRQVNFLIDVIKPSWKDWFIQEE